MKGAEGEWPSLDSLARSAPYIVPEQNDLSIVQQRVAAKVDELQDQIRSLREDPAYFADLASEWSEHLGERLPDAKGKPHTGINDGSSGQREFWDQVVHGVIYKTHEHVYHWRELNVQLQEIIVYQAAPYHSPQDKRNYHKTVLKMKILMEKEMFRNLQGTLNIFVTCSPGSRHLFHRQVEPHTYAGWGIVPRLECSRAMYRDDLMWFFVQLILPEACEILGWELLAFEFESLLRDKAHRPRISKLLAEYFSLFGLLGLLRQQLRICFPRVFNDSGDIAEWDMDMSLHGWYSRFREPMRELNSVAVKESRKFLDLHGEGDPTSGKFSYPVNKRRTKESTGAMQRAERNLDNFWAIYDTHVDGVCIPETKWVFRDLLPQNKELMRTPDWVEPEKTSCIANQHDAAKRDLPPTPFVHSQETAPHPKSSVLLPLRSKPKTRGAASTPPGPSDGGGGNINVDEDGGLPVQDTAQPQFAVKARAYKVFSTLFYTPTPHSQPGDARELDRLFARHECHRVPAGETPWVCVKFQPPAERRQVVAAAHQL